MIYFLFRLLTLLHIGSDARHTKDLISHQYSKATISSNTFLLYAVRHMMKSLKISLHIEIIRFTDEAVCFVTTVQVKLKLCSDYVGYNHGNVDKLQVLVLL